MTRLGGRQPNAALALLWSDDLVAQAFVRANPLGAPASAVAAREHAEQSARVMRGVRGGVVADADRASMQLGLLASG